MDPALQDDDVQLLGSTDNVNSSYNFGPRKATDKISACLFGATMLAFIIWGGVGIGGGGKNTIFIVDYNGSEWVRSYHDSSTCCRVQDSDCIQLIGGDFEADAASASDDSETECINSLSDSDIQGDIASPICLAIFGSLVMGSLLLLGFRHVPHGMVYFVVIVKIVVPVVAGLYLLTQSGKDGADLTYPAYICFAVAGILALVFWIYRKELDLCARLFKVSSVGMTENWILLPIAAAMVTIATGIKLALIAYIVVNIFMMEVVPNPAAYAITDDDLSDECMVQLKSGWENFPIFGFGLVVSWFAFIVLELRNYIVGDVIGAWYWHGKKGASASRALKHAFCSHFGTLCFSALVMWFVEKLKKKAKYRGVNVISCIIACIARCILSCDQLICADIEFLCKMSVIVTAITGNDLIGSGKKVVSMFTESFGNMKASTGVWWIPSMIISTFVFILSAVASAASGLIMYAAIRTQGHSCSDTSVPAMGGAVIGFIVFVLCLFLLSFFGSILLSTVDTVYMCFMLDKSRGVVTHPELHDILEQVLSKRKDVQMVTTQVVQNGAVVQINQQIVVTNHSTAAQSAAAPPPKYDDNEQTPGAQFVQQQPPMQQQYAQQQPPVLHQYSQEQPNMQQQYPQHQPPVQQQYSQHQPPIQQQYSQQQQYGHVQQSQQNHQQNGMQPQYQEKTTFCTSCGAQIPLGAKFCSVCGTHA